MTLKVGIDVGGTFTDLMVFDSENKKSFAIKVSSNPKNPIEAVLNAIQFGNLKMSDIETIIHGTTVATNSLLEKKGARTAFVCTKGFTDVIFIQRMNRKHHYDLKWDKPKLPVKRRYCFDIDERVNYKGEVLKELNENDVVKLAKIFKREKIEAVAVCCLFSYLHPNHEIRIREIFKNVLPDVKISLSHEVFPRWREYERASTTIIDAFLKPSVSLYVKNLQNGLKKNEFNSNLLMMKSNGGVTDFNSVTERPSDIILSGPVGGVIASQYIGKVTNRKNLISADMGGTSFDVSLIYNGKFARSKGVELEWGIPIRTSMVEVKTIGAGGGSIAWIDKGGLLRVGPESAGSNPGPVCYDRGGDKPTVTDANLILGRLNPENFAGGNFKLNKELSYNIVDKLANKINKSIYETSIDIIKLVNWNMVNAIRLISIDKGFDPRNFSLVSFGGACSAHCAELAKLLDLKDVVVPINQGVFSAFGLNMSDMRVDVSKTANMRSDFIDLKQIKSVFKTLEKNSLNQIKNEGYTGLPKLYKILEMRYLGQNYGVDVTLPDSVTNFDEKSIKKVFELFALEHKKLYGYDLPNEIVEIVNFHISCIGKTKKSAPEKLGNIKKSTRRSKRKIYFEKKGFLDCDVYLRDDLVRNQKISGPCVIEENNSVTLLHPNQKTIVDEYGNLIINVN
ncbi:MAG: hydantoin utilization protein [Deltaproteobacteria bacterium]|nr:hydantoin utilization protein [Deltaproteobacteria bacterium]|tara:strand:+ start:254 stop:2287 length:2034 start_codon:yes stop_codon:yes gene_type:complete